MCWNLRQALESVSHKQSEMYPLPRDRPSGASACMMILKIEWLTGRISPIGRDLLAQCERAYPEALPDCG